MIHYSDLDPAHHPHQVQFARDDKTYRATWRHPSLVNLFLVNGQYLEPLGAYDCTSVNGEGSIASAACQIVATESDPRFTYQPSELQAQIAKALAIAQSLNQSDSRSRELSLTITKLQEAEMWLKKALKNSGTSGN